jgi:hypothetical protein
MQRIFIRKYFLFTVGSVCPVNVHSWVERRGKYFADIDEVEMEVAGTTVKRVRGGSSALIKQRDKCYQ